MTMVVREYDSIISLGGFCGAANQLRARGLRHKSFPFDWLYMEDSHSIQWLTKAFADDFSTFMLRENLEPITSGGGGVAPYCYRDKKSGFCFIHHFHHDIENGGYGEVRAKMDRRIARLLASFSKGKRVLCILATRFPFEPALAEYLLQTIRRRFPQTMVDLELIQFGADFGSTGVLSKAWSSTWSFTGAAHARTSSEYDNDVTSSEWSFLDRITLRGVPVREPKGIMKLAYKIWKSISKRLRDCGYACLGFRFSRKL